MKRISISFIVLLFCSLRSPYPADNSPQLEWLVRKTVVVNKITKEEFDLLKPYFSHLLDSDIYKEHVFAIFNYLLREKFDPFQQMAIMRELALLLSRQPIRSKDLRNFISGRIKAGRVKGMGNQILFAFLIDEIRILKPQDKYKSTPHKLINQPNRK